MTTAGLPIGPRLREWRQRRGLSQLDLALDSDISARHLSFVETGRSHPSRDMVLRLAERLEVPLRDRNLLLVSAGFAPVFPERPLSDAALAGARRAVDRVLQGHEPYPALAVDRHWTLVASNRAVMPLLEGVSPSLLAPPLNVLRVSLHPEGMAPRIANFAEWRGHILERLRRQVNVSADPALAALMEELTAYPAPRPPHRTAAQDHDDVAVALKLVTDGGETLSFVSTTTVFGTPVDVTLAELAIESFFPADAGTAEALRSLAAV